MRRGGDSPANGGGAVSAWRRHLLDAGYTAEALKRLLGAGVPDDVGLLNHAAALERVRLDHSPAATAVQLFFLEGEVDAPRLAAIMPGRACQSLAEAGAVRVRAGRVRARIRIDPVGDQYFLADRRFGATDARALHLPGREPVYPPSSDSVILRDAIVPGDARTVLDLCTGSGVQALQQARNVERVIAVDVSPRAAALARLNAQLNGIGNVEVRCGDLYRPVGGVSFDLIIANPPFVASPHTRSPRYHSGGATGDRVLRRVIAGLGTHLSPGGRAFVISHVAVRAGETMEDLAAAWFDGFPGRAAVLVLETGTAVDLAAAQSLFALDRGLSSYAREVRRWVAYLRRHRIHTVSLVLIVAERHRHQRRGRRSIEVVQAQPRVLPLPLSPPPVDRIRRWLEG